MKKGGNRLFLIAGVGLAVIAVALFVSSMVGGGTADTEKQDDKLAQVTVVEAAVDIPAHTLLMAEDLIEVQVPESEAPADAVRSKAEVIGLAYRVPLVKGQRLVASQTEQPGLRNEINVGMRAISVPVNQVSLLSGLVQDGDHVDVIFHARINPVRLLPTNLAITPEDQAYYKFGSGGGNNDEEETQTIDGWIAPDVDVPNHPFTGDPGSQFIIRDDIAEAQQLEPVAKIMVQDVRVLRAVRPGESFGPTGVRTDPAAVEGSSFVTTDDMPGYLILEVTPEQAEVLTFMQDRRHEYQVIVRGKDDRETVTTTGITFQILATNVDWSLPWPKSLTAPREQTRGSNNRTSTRESQDSPGAADGEEQSSDN